MSNNTKQDLNKELKEVVTTVEKAAKSLEERINTKWENAGGKDYILKKLREDLEKEKKDEIKTHLDELDKTRQALRIILEDGKHIDRDGKEFKLEKEDLKIYKKFLEANKQEIENEEETAKKIDNIISKESLSDEDIKYLKKPVNDYFAKKYEIINKDSLEKLVNAGEEALKTAKDEEKEDLNKVITILKSHVPDYYTGSWLNDEHIKYTKTLRSKGYITNGEKKKDDENKDDKGKDDEGKDDVTKKEKKKEEKKGTESYTYNQIYRILKAGFVAAYASLQAKEESETVFSMAYTQALGIEGYDIKTGNPMLDDPEIRAKFKDSEKVLSETIKATMGQNKIMPKEFGKYLYNISTEALEKNSKKLKQMLLDPDYLIAVCGRDNMTFEEQKEIVEKGVKPEQSLNMYTKQIFLDAKIAENPKVAEISAKLAKETPQIKAWNLYK